MHSYAEVQMLRVYQIQPVHLLATAGMLNVDFFQLVSTRFDH